MGRQRLDVPMKETGMNKKCSDDCCKNLPGDYERGVLFTTFNLLEFKIKDGSGVQACFQSSMAAFTKCEVIYQVSHLVVMQPDGAIHCSLLAKQKKV